MEKTDDFIGALLTDGFCNIVGNAFVLDLNSEEVWDKSMDIANTDLNNLKDFDTPKVEDVETKVNNENESYFFRY